MRLINNATNAVKNKCFKVFAHVYRSQCHLFGFSQPFCEAGNIVDCPCFSEAEVKGLPQGHRWGDQRLRVRDRV